MEQKLPELVPFLTQQQLDDIKKQYKNLHIMPQELVSLSMSKIRTVDCNLQDFRFHSNRVIRLLIEYALTVQQQDSSLECTPLAQYDCKTLKQEDEYVGVMIMRAGNAFMGELMNVIPNIQIGTILIQRDEGSRTKDPIFYYSKFPKNVDKKKILICDPMLATGGSVLKTIEELVSKGVQQKNISFLNIMGCQEGIKRVSEKYPDIKIIVAGIEPVLTNIKYLSPGLGDFGDRYFGTDRD